MRMMAMAMVVFFLAIGTATFLESAYDIQTAKIIIYNALWFELLLTFLCINLIANIFTYKMYKRDKIAMLMFHIAFIVIIIGAGVTRFFGFEGMLLVREQAQTDFIYSADPYFWVTATDGSVTSEPFSKKMYMSEVTDNYFNVELDGFPNRAEPISIEYIDFKKNLIDSLVVNDSIKGTSLEIVTGGMTSNYVSEGGFLMVGQTPLSYAKDDVMPGGIEIVKDGPKMMLKSAQPLRYLAMSSLQAANQAGGVNDSMYTNVPADTLVPFQTATLYQVGNEQFVFKGILKNSKMMRMPSGRKDEGVDCLTVKVTDGKTSKIVDLNGGFGQIPDNTVFNLNGVSYQMQYGSMRIRLPFFVRCEDFRLEKYPGSNSPSAFESDVTVIDEELDVTFSKTIFMNHVMDYRGYRFFQSGYDPDEGGTRLSVNYDSLGTNISYFGYLMMGVGMIMSLIFSNGRFRQLNRKLKKSREKREKILNKRNATKAASRMSAFVGMLLLSSLAFAQEHDHAEGDGHDHSAHNHDAHNHSADQNQDDREIIFRIMSEEHSDEFASLLVQNFQGRIVPMHTLCDQLLRKLYRGNKYEEYNAVQAVMSMHMYQEHWMAQPIIYVSGKSNLRDKLKMEGTHISYNDLTNKETGEFILAADYAKAHQTIEAKRGEFEKRVIQLGERYQVISMIFTWKYMQFVPLRGDENNKWYVPFDPLVVQGDSTSRGAVMRYLNALNKASEDGKYGNATDLLNDVKGLQRDISKNVVPSERNVAMEISYNKMNIFANSYKSYTLIGVFLLLLFFVRIFVSSGGKAFKWLSRIGTILAAIIFLYHGYGLYMRWAISGHAPWSNGYEAVVFIAWMTVLTGLIFSRKNAIILAGTVILAGLMIYVTEMNLMDPEITQLQPVLKSYWLMIHVAIITGSYGPLGISCILGLLNLALYIMRTKKNGDIVTLNINEITYVSEMTMTIGVFMLTIGTFLGGIWANESWGRYWGWDPKETWALVAILVYAVILHFRFIPALKSKFTFNVASFWGYSAILFTFFGVNFYLVGLHSYAQGDGLGKFPTSIIVTTIIFALFTLLAWIRNRQYKKSSLNEALIDE